MTDDQRRYWVGFNMMSGIGPVAVRRLLSYFGTLEAAWQAKETDLRAAGIDAKARQTIATRRAKIDLDEALERIDRYHVRVLTWDDPDYPPRLKEIYAPPPVLYVRGDILAEDEWSIAVVGTRHATAYGRQAADYLVGELARNKITVISGLALGIDTLAHQAALEHGGRTIAVSPCGVDLVYPSQNTGLARRIIDQGALVSSFPMGSKPQPGNFPYRNSIMSGMSLGVLVVEAGERSGAHITVEHALSQDREVFAVPGSIFAPLSVGTNRWIQRGAKLVSQARDILEELNLTMVAQQLEMKLLLPADETEALLLKHLSAQPVHIDELGRESHLPISTVSSVLAVMELKGLVRQVGGMKYIAGEPRPVYEASIQ